VLFWRADTYVNLQQNVIRIVHLSWVFVKCNICQSVGNHGIVSFKSDDKLTVREQHILANVFTQQ